MDQYVPPADNTIPPGAPRPRAISSASHKYTPGQYTPGAEQPSPSAPMPIPQAQARVPLIAGQPIAATPPVANAAYYGSSPGYFGTSPGTAAQAHMGTPPVPQPFQQGYLGTPPSIPYPQSQVPAPRSVRANSQGAPYPADPADITDASGLMRPPVEHRRASASSTHSRHSAHSGHTDHSHRSRRDSHRSSHRLSEDEYDDSRRSRDSHRSERRHGEDDDLKLKRTKTHRPTWGDSIYGVLGVIKDALGPRDKY